MSFQDYLAQHGWDALAAVGTAAATILAVWQSGGAVRERQRATGAALATIEMVIDEAVAILEEVGRSGAGTARAAATLETLHQSMFEVRLGDLPTKGAVAAACKARGAMLAASEHLSHRAPQGLARLIDVSSPSRLLEESRTTLQQERRRLRSRAWL